MATLAQALSRHHEVHAVVEAPGVHEPPTPGGVSIHTSDTLPRVDLDLYSIASSTDHAFAYRAALRRPGVVFFHEWILHDLVWAEARAGSDTSGYLREMRRSHGPVGTFVGRQVVLGRGGALLPELFAVNDRLVEGSLGVAAATAEIGDRIARRHEVPLLHCPEVVPAGCPPAISREDARRSLGLPEDSLILTAHSREARSSGLDALVRAVARLREEFPSLLLVVTGEVSDRSRWRERAAEAGLDEALSITGPVSREDRLRHLVAADVVAALSFPSRGGLPHDLVAALGCGRATLVTAGTPATKEMPEGVVVPIGPGPREEEELVGLVGELLANRALRDDVGAAARAHASAHRGLRDAGDRLSDFLEEVHARRAERDRIVSARAEESSLEAHFLDEVRWAARDLGVDERPLGLESLLGPLARAGR